MPVDLQVGSIDLNRMRSQYIRLMQQLWQQYTKVIFNSTCPLFGSYTAEGHLLPTQELCDIAQCQ